MISWGVEGGIGGADAAQTEAACMVTNCGWVRLRELREGGWLGDGKLDSSQSSCCTWTGGWLGSVGGRGAVTGFQDTTQLDWD